MKPEQIWLDAWTATARGGHDVSACTLAADACLEHWKTRFGPKPVTSPTEARPTGIQGVGQPAPSGVSFQWSEPNDPDTWSVEPPAPAAPTRARPRLGALWAKANRKPT